MAGQHACVVVWAQGIEGHEGMARRVAWARSPKVKSARETSDDNLGLLRLLGSFWFLSKNHPSKFGPAFGGKHTSVRQQWTPS